MRPREGDQVSVNLPDYPGIWKVESTRGSVNAILSQEGRAKRLRAPYTLLIEPTDAPLPPSVVALAAYYDQGELVRVPDGRYAGLYVVLSDKGGKTVMLTKLGGWGGKRLSSPRRGLVRVPVTDVLTEGATL